MHRSQHKVSPSTWAVARQIVKNDGFGFRGLNKGVTATIGRNGLFNMIYFGFFHSVNSKITQPEVCTIGTCHVPVLHVWCNSDFHKFGLLKNINIIVLSHSETRHGYFPWLNILQSVSWCTVVYWFKTMALLINLLCIAVTWDAFQFTKQWRNLLHILKCCN